MTSLGTGPGATVCDFTPRHVRRRLILLSLITTDLVAGMCAVTAAGAVRFHVAHAPLTLAGMGVRIDYLLIATVIALAFPAFFATQYLYDIDALFWGSGEFSRVVQAVTLTIGTTIIASYLLKIDNFSRMWLFYVWLFSSFTLVTGRWIFRTVLRVVRRRSGLMRPTLIVGCNDDARRLAISLAADQSSGLALIGCLSADPLGCEPGTELIPGVATIGHVGELPQIVTESNCDAVVIISSAFEHATVSSIVSELRRLPIDVHISSGLFDVLPARVLVREVAGTPFMLVRPTSLSAYKLRLKRAFDLGFSLAILILGMPLWLLIAAAIKLDSPGPVFYRQRRMGRNGEAFDMLKFRSMRTDADDRLAELLPHNEADGPLFKMRRDPRVTRVGRRLRRYSLDEFPQLLNVLLGQMSVVGPRPPLQTEFDTYTRHHAKRLEVAPGMTGLWQVSGRSDLTFEEMVRLDLFYIENWSLRYDLTLVLRTIPTIIGAGGAY